jgi:iron(II)-dependent oxidoreductase
MKELFNELEGLQNEVLNLVRAVSEDNYHQQFHPDLSPIGWHLGHCVYTESYWIREALLGKETIDNSLKSLYVPELSDKACRGSVLPEKDKLLAWAKLNQTENCELLETAINKKNVHHLLENDFLLHFLIQHYSQHIETMFMVLSEMQLQQISDVAFNSNQQHKLLTNEFKPVKAGSYDVGSNRKELSYDNERPLHSITLNKFSISSLPVSNNDFFQFIKNNGYSIKDYWTEEGWAWLKLNQFKQPHHWRNIQNERSFYGVDHNGAYALNDEQPVHGLSYFEAEAYANWKGTRLPHEHEWEVAAVNNYLQQTGLVWEWCSNTFHPYENFQPYPYHGYSVPYFDSNHYVLRGGSRYSKDRIKRASFRNYYTADKRHIFAGLRLAYK